MGCVPVLTLLASHVVQLARYESVVLGNIAVKWFLFSCSCGVWRSSDTSWSCRIAISLWLTPIDRELCDLCIYILLLLLLEVVWEGMTRSLGICWMACCTKEAKRCGSRHVSRGGDVEESREVGIFAVISSWLASDAIIEKEAAYSSRGGKACS